MTEQEGLCFKGNRVVIPKSMRRGMIEKLHYTHQGVEKTKVKAREILFWPGMNKQIQDTISNCPTCLNFRKNNVKEPLIPHEVPKVPWAKVGVDLFHLNGQDFVLVIDYYSKYVEIGVLKTTVSEAVIRLLKKIFAR